MVETVFSYFYNASFGTIYPTLSKMEKEGLITKESVIQEGRPNKNVYSITEEGQKHFKAYMYSPVEANEFKSDAMTRLFFGEFIEVEVIIEYLENGVSSTIDDLERLRNMYEIGKSSSLLSPTKELCIQIGIESMESTLRTLMAGVERLSKLQMEKRENESG